MNAPLKNIPPPPISALHAMLATIERETHPHHLNRIINEPSVKPWVEGYDLGRLDAAALMANPANVVLGGEFAVVVLQQIMPTLYEVHVQCLPEGRGEWMLLFSHAWLHWMFTRMDATEIIAKLPMGNLPVKALARRLGFRHRFTHPRGFIRDLDPVPCEVVSILIEDWVEAAPGLAERGHWFIDRLNSEFSRLGGNPMTVGDAESERFIGVTAETLFANMPMKAMFYHNRWAALSGHPIMHLLTIDPLAVDIGSAQIVVRPQEQDFWVVLAK